MFGHKLIPLVTVSLFVLGACGSGSADGNQKGSKGHPGPQSGQGTALTADEKACEDFYHAEMDFTGRCGGIVNGSQPAISRFRTLCARQLVAPGAETLRDARAKCGELLKTAACDDDLPDCELPPGSLADGEPCAGREQCQSRYCKLSVSGCGTCAQLVKPEGECATAADCASGKDEVASCDYKQGASTGTCSVWKIVKAGKACNAQAFCDMKSHCDVPDKNAKSGTCLANLDADKPCDDTRACRPGLVCTNHKCAAKPKEGEPCDAIDACADGLACDGTCKPTTYVGAREKCDTVHRCARGRCVQPVAQDQNGHASPTGDATCVDPIPDGQPCSEEQARSGAVCDAFAQCIGNKCVMETPDACH
jgi:hypothetical protein